MPRDATTEGSWSNDVLYAYFAIAPPGRLNPLPPSFTEFLADSDTAVTFVLHVRRLTSVSILRGTLRRPDRSVHATFEREVSAWYPGGARDYATHEEFAMSALRSWPGSWTLDLFRGEEQVGRYRFVLLR